MVWKYMNIKLFHDCVLQDVVDNNYKTCVKGYTTIKMQQLVVQQETLLS